MIDIEVSDPWDWITKHGSGPFKGVAVANSQRHVLVKLQKSLPFADVDNDYILGTVRHSDESFQSLKRGLDVPCNIWPLTTDELQGAEGGSPLEKSHHLPGKKAQGVSFGKYCCRLALKVLLGALARISLDTIQPPIKGNVRCPTSTARGAGLVMSDIDRSRRRSVNQSSNRK